MPTLKPENFSQQYKKSITSGDLLPDDEQQSAVIQMQSANEQIEAFYQSQPSSILNNLFSSTSQENTVKGIYLWGGVGRGKTHLLDMFFESLPFKEKLRIHFHRFMQLIHESLEQFSDVELPLEKVAKDLASKYKLICLDEIFVVDITDAMLLGDLFKALATQKVCVLYTSNSHPDELYKNGLQRVRFLPAIEHIKKHSHVIEIKGNNDFRLHALESTKLYQLTSDKDHESNMESLFNVMAGGLLLNEDRDDLIINYRRLPVKKWESGIVWFSFDMICNTHRDSSDYIRIATFFHSVFVSQVYPLSSEQDDVARRFINMIDVFYDRNINLIVSASVLPDDLYVGTRLAFEFKRTRSRLIEMQTEGYLAKNKLVKENLEKELDSIDNKDEKAWVEGDSNRSGDWVINGRCSDF